MLKMTDLNRQTVTVDHLPNEENHWFFYNSYQEFLEEREDSKPFQEKEVFSIQNYAALLKAIPLYILLTKYLSHYYNFFTRELLKGLYTIL